MELRPHVRMETPIVIIGAGLAGLSLAEGLLKKGYRVVVLERYPNVGGRIVTNREPFQYEIGAGRIFHTHVRVHELIRKFRLHTYPISSDISWVDSKSQGTPVQNAFAETFQTLLPTLQRLPKRVLATHTLGQLVPKQMNPLLKQYPYWAELHMIRADLALPLFAKKAEMGTYEGYVGIQEGIDALTSRLRIAVEKAGGIILTRYRVEDVRRQGVLWEIMGNYGKKAEAQPFQIFAEKVVIATCRCSLSTFSALQGKPLLDQLQTSPLIRIYAAYPRRKGVLWWQDIPKCVTDSPLRFIIPINPKTGLIMISYTDGPTDTNHWRGLEGKALQLAIQKEVRRLFPDKDIPEPTFLKKHDWPSGCTYWVPTETAYDLKKAQRDAMHPAKNLWIVGESVSFQQGWMEGALETAEQLLAEF
jgi:monoamine oxidase